MRKGQPISLNPNFLILNPVSRGGTWSAQLGSDVMTLWNPDNKRILTVPKEAMASHIRFARDIFRGRTVSFVVIPGMKAYTFRCNRDTLDKLRNWLPLKSSEQVRKEVRLNAVAIVLFGVFFLIRSVDFHWLWGVCFLSVGAVGICYPKQRQYLLNGLLMFLFAAAQIIPGPLRAVDQGTAFDTRQLLSIMGICVFVCWAVQQFSMLGPNAQIRSARVSRRGSSLRAVPRESALVRKIARFALAASLVLWVYIASLLCAYTLGLPRPEDAEPGLAHPAWADWIAFPALGLFTLLAGAYLTLRKAQAYLDAKIVGQVLIILGVCIGWGLVGTFRPAEPLSLFDPILASGGLTLFKPHVWVSLLVFVLAFNRWFARAVDRELEQASERDASGTPG